jgi:predicted DNA-binding transcriptional regulator AlpA
MSKNCSCNLNHTTPSKFLTTKEAARFIGMKQGTLEVWRVQGRGPRFFKIGRAVRYTEDVLETFLAKSIRASTSE